MATTPAKWDVEDGAFWDATGKSIANRNQWVMKKWTSTCVGEGGQTRHVHDARNRNENVRAAGGN